MKAERAVQLSFSKIAFLQSFTIIAIVLLFDWWQGNRPDRAEAGWRSTSVEFQPVKLNPGNFGVLRLVGAWTVASEDARFGGISALAIADGEFVALTDSGVVVKFPKPRREAARALIGELPDGPGDPRFKVNRDSEALVLDPSLRGWRVAFETRNEMWLYDIRFKRSLERVRFSRTRWPRNRGIEGLATAGRSLLLLPEPGDGIVQVGGSRARPVPIHLPAGRIADAARLPSGDLLVLNRRLTPLGFSNSLATLRPSRNGYVYGERIELGVGSLDNIEALAPEQLSGGGVRLWLMTDDGHQRPFRTLLLALDLPVTP